MIYELRSCHGRPGRLPHINKRFNDVTKRWDSLRNMAGRWARHKCIQRNGRLDVQGLPRHSPHL
jgi:hypothetical protein